MLAQQLAAGDPYLVEVVAEGISAGEALGKTHRLSARNEERLVIVEERCGANQGEAQCERG